MLAFFLVYSMYQFQVAQTKEISHVQKKPLLMRQTRSHLHKFGGNSCNYVTDQQYPTWEPINIRAYYLNTDQDVFPSLEMQVGYSVLIPFGLYHIPFGLYHIRSIWGPCKREYQMFWNKIMFFYLLLQERHLSVIITGNFWKKVSFV